MMPLPQNTALIIIDVQQGMDAPHLAPRNNPDAEKNMVRLLTMWRREKRPIFHVKHNSTEPNSPLRPELPGNQIKPEVAPQEDEPVISKTVNSAFIGTDLEERLHTEKINTLVIAGLTTNHCVSTTVRMAENLGFKTYIVSDATAAFDTVGPDGTQYTAQQIHDISLASLHDEFATVVRTNDVLTAGHVM